MTQNCYKIPRQSDRQLEAALRTLSEEFGGFTLHATVLGNGIGEAQYPASMPPIWIEILAKDAEIIDSFHTTLHGVTLQYVRGGRDGEIWQKSPVWDDLLINTNGLATQSLSIATRITELLRPVSLPNPASTDDLLQAQRALQEATFARLERQFERLVEETINVRKQLDEHVANKETELEAKFQDQMTAGNADLNAKREKLDGEREALEARRKAVDDSDNTHARRQIRERMLSDVANRVNQFNLSPVTVGSRKPVMLGMTALALLFLSMLLWTSYELTALNAIDRQLIETAIKVSSQSPQVSSPQPVASLESRLLSQSAIKTQELWALWLRLTLSSLGLAATLLYYIRWQNQWAQQFAQTELSLQQFHIDVNRANWVIETCLEWRKETSTDIPAPLIESMTRSLFSSNEANVQVLHPADELASALMGTASKVSLDIGGNKVEIDKPKKIPKSIVSTNTV